MPSGVINERVCACSAQLILCVRAAGNLRIAVRSSVAPCVRTSADLFTRVLLKSNSSHPFNYPSLYYHCNVNLAVLFFFRHLVLDLHQRSILAVSSGILNFGFK